ncbi:YitT family protein [Jeotgalibacillus sp. ET6]|uniref:YitT family protein n=1 Tax=Jeotgalibacillus sp. ET6 TaxID=3037260 RepID=UPI00241861FF|nr:YitT family protein [Jeotgalibacillus sp. ET6]MDG5472969.1 YitT family protein [Jeotgalibacillus sp. ET6]
MENSKESFQLSKVPNETLWLEIRKIIVVIIGAALNAAALNLFLIPANVFASGFTGLAQLISNILADFTPIFISTGILLLLLNIPAIILGWLRVGKMFTIYSLVSVGFTTIFLAIIPVVEVSTDILLNAVFGGVIAGIGVGFTLKWGASTGGMDIIAMILSRLNDKPVGIYFFTMNAVIILAASTIFGLEEGLYTLVTLYVSTRMIDAIHTRHEKLTVMIVTKKTSEVKQAIHENLVRGITILPARGAFTDEQKEMLIIVITRYELFELERIIHSVDPHAFTNVMQTTGVFGFFRKEE